MQSIRVGRFQRPGQKHKVASFAILPKKQREASCLNVSNNFRRRGSREIISLARGLGPRRPQYISPYSAPVI